MPSPYQYQGEDWSKTDFDIDIPFPSVSTPSVSTETSDTIKQWYPIYPYGLALAFFAYLVWTTPKLLRIRSLRRETPIVAAFKFK